MNKYQLINLHNDEKIDDIEIISIIRKEHPNCAIYKKTVVTADEDITRTTLFTPKKRISRDESPATDAVLSNYISAEKHLGTFLYYLKDISAASNDMNILFAESNGVLVGELSCTPYGEIMGNWMDTDKYSELSTTKDFGRCLSQIKKNLIKEIECAKSVHEKYDIKYFTFRDSIDVMDSETFDKHYYEYYRMLHKELPDCNILIKLNKNIDDYGKMLHRKHLAGALVCVPEDEDNS